MAALGGTFTGGRTLNVVAPAATLAGPGPAAGAGVVAAATDGPPAKRGRYDPMVTRALADQLAQHEADQVAHKASALLLARVKAHPLYPFAVRVAGSSGRGGQLEPLLLFDTVAGQQAVAAVIEADKKQRVVGALRERLALEMHHLLMPPPPPPATGGPPAAPSGGPAPPGTDLAASALDLQAAIAQREAAGRQAAAQRADAQQFKVRLENIQASRGFRALVWRFERGHDIDRTAGAARDALTAFAGRMDGAKKAPQAKFWENRFVADNFGSNTDTYAYVTAAAKFLGYEAPIRTTGTTDVDSNRLVVARALLSAFLTDVFRDAPLGAQHAAWFVEAPVLSVCNYALLAYLVLVPWNTMAHPASTTRSLMKDLLAQSTMFQKVLGRPAPEFAADPASYVFGLLTQELDASRAETAQQPQGAPRPRRAPSVTTRGSGGPEQVSTDLDTSRVTEASHDEPSKARLGGAPFSGGPRFRGGVSFSGPPPAALQFRGARTYLQDMYAAAPDAPLLFPWLDTVSEFAGDNAWDGDTRKIDAAAFGMCLQEALCAINDHRSPTDGAGGVLDFFLGRLGGASTQEHADLRAAFVKNVLVRLGKLMDRGLFTAANNPATRSDAWTQQVTLPALDAHMATAMANQVRVSSSDPQPYFAFVDDPQNGLADYLAEVVGGKIKDMGDLADQLTWESTLQSIAAHYKDPPAIPTPDDYQQRNPDLGDAPAWVTALNNTLDDKQTGGRSAVVSVPPWLRDFWNESAGAGRGALLASHSPLQWIADLIAATKKAIAAGAAQIDAMAAAEVEIRRAIGQQQAEQEAVAAQLRTQPPLAGPGGPPPAAASPLAQLGAALEADIAELRALDERAQLDLKQLKDQQARAMALLQRASGFVTERADWLQAMESAFRYLQGLNPDAAHWCDRVGSARSLGESPNPQVLTAFAGLARCFMNTNEESAGSRGTYQQAVYYGHNMRRAGDYANSLLATDPSDVTAGGFAHMNLL